MIGVFKSTSRYYFTSQNYQVIKGQYILMSVCTSLPQNMSIRKIVLLVTEFLVKLDSLFEEADSELCLWPSKLI